MIVGKDINPKRDLYYLGALTLRLIQKDGKVRADFFDLFHELNKQGEVSIRLFALTLNWLYLLDMIKTHDDTVELCS